MRCFGSWLTSHHSETKQANYLKPDSSERLEIHQFQDPLLSVSRRSHSEMNYI